MDLCGGARWPAVNTSWIKLRHAIDACPARRLVLSVEYCNSAACAPWVSTLADLWRTTGDVQANFASILSNLDNNNAMSEAQRSGKYNDPDLLVVGLPGVSLAEAQTQFGAWALVAAPLLLSLDITQPLPAGVLAIITNKEVLAVSQDAAQVQGVRVSPPAPDGQECWARPLAPPAGAAGATVYMAALLLNRADQPAVATCTWAQLGLDPAASATVRDLYAQADRGIATSEFSQRLAPHASLLITLTVPGGL